MDRVRDLVAEGGVSVVLAQDRDRFPDDERDAPAVISSELPTNEGSSITYAAEQLAAEVIRYHRLARPVVWVEHHPPITTDGDTETFDLVDFSSYEVVERAPNLGETRLRVGRLPGSG
jgi:hypothetical protein